MGMQAIIEQKLNAGLKLSHLAIENESHLHRGPATDSHFKLVVVSDDFAGKGRVARHQLIYGLLADELAQDGGIHALVMHTHTPEEWQANGQTVPKSAPCRSAH
ncbi:BolA family protein [Motiliproteus sediminis]|uniref:BolA family protein n=1 Tax=Motiliproteus sediminis TaxID=1468178 RepID=UPI001AEF9BB3|nr:BolA/IbaG family iron-sulfur metabolism protein [Motiliproteus sediminis]